MLLTGREGKLNTDAVSKGMQNINTSFNNQNIDVDTSISAIATEDNSNTDVDTSISTIATEDNLNTVIEITNEMQEEEKRMTELNLKKEKEFMRKLEEKAALDRELLDQRHKRLMHLLTKSQFYSEFLIQKLDTHKDDQQVEGNKRKRRKVDLEEKENDGIKNFYSERKSKNPLGSALSEKNISTCTNSNVPESPKNHILEKQPALLENGIMRSYQLEGFAWLKTLYDNGISGILADEMGLGKTIQCIAMFCHLIRSGIHGPFLVVAPLSTLPNWIGEFKRFAPKIPTLLYHGSEKVRVEKRKMFNKRVRIPGTSDRTCPIIITSYEVAIRDVSFFRKFHWQYLAVDEGHRLKNYRCLLTRCLNSLPSTNRIILTGTPLQNNLSELWSLLNFLLPDIFDNLDVFESWFEISDMMEEGSDERIVQQEKEKQIVSTLHKILNPFLLRRIKADMDLEIPGKKELLVYVPMTQLQLDLYKAAITKDFSAFVDTKKSQDIEIVEVSANGRPKRNRKERMKLSVILNDSDDNDEALDQFLTEVVDIEDDKRLNLVKVLKQTEDNFNIRNIMMLCRKIVNHPYLLQYPLTPEGEYKIDEELVKQCGKLQVLDQILKELQLRNHRVLIFSQLTKLLDIIEDYLSLRPQYKYKRLDGSVKLEDRHVDIDDFNNDGKYFLYLLSTRAGGLGINLTSADTVIIYDSDWNPQQDLQAQDRCHRIGQTKPVLILRFVAASTVDQEMVERAETKRKLEKVIMKAGNFKASRFSERKLDDKVDPEELLRLLQSRDCDRIYKASKGDGIYTQAELNQLLDRSDLMKNSEPKAPSEMKYLFRTISKV